MDGDGERKDASCCSYYLIIVGESIIMGTARWEVAIRRWVMRKVSSIPNIMLPELFDVRVSPRSSHCCKDH